MKTLIIGLTGPIASGKNEVAKILEKLRARIIDVDEIGHKVIEPDQPAWEKLVKHFGIKILTTNGRVNRVKLSEIVFSNPDELRMLNHITHPEIFKTVKTEINRNKLKNLVINAALLKQIGLDKLCDKIIAVIAPKSKRIARLRKKNLNFEQIKAIMDAQPKDFEFKKIADFVINNSGNIKKLNLIVPKIFDLL